MQFTIGRYAIALGLRVGLMEFIPVIGAFLGAVPAVAVALLVSPVQALIVAALFLVAQQIEGNVLVPKVIGDSVNVHPLWVLFGVMAASALYGIVGALLALPAIAIISATLGYLRNTLLFEPWRKPPVSPAGASTQGDAQNKPQPPPEIYDGTRRPREGASTTGQPRAPTFPGDRRGRLGER